MLVDDLVLESCLLYLEEEKIEEDVPNANKVEFEEDILDNVLLEMEIPIYPKPGKKGEYHLWFLWLKMRYILRIYVSLSKLCPFCSSFLLQFLKKNCARVH